MGFFSILNTSLDFSNGMGGSFVLDSVGFVSLESFSSWGKGKLKGCSSPAGSKAVVRFVVAL